MIAPSDHDEPDDLSNNLDKGSDSEFDIADSKNKKKIIKKNKVNITDLKDLRK